MKTDSTRIFAIPFATVYPLYIKKVERKWQRKEGVDEVIFWLTGYDSTSLQKQLDHKVNFEVFFREAPHMNPNVSKITGSICGVKIEEIENPLMKQIRYLDTLVDEVANGKEMEKILRK